MQAIWSYLGSPARSRPRRASSVPGRPGRAAFTGRGRSGGLCRCDGGPHGCPSRPTHADALPWRCGTTARHPHRPRHLRHHGEPVWQQWFRSTAAHNTIEIGAEPVGIGGPFLERPPATTTLACDVATSRYRAGAPSTRLSAVGPTHPPPVRDNGFTRRRPIVDTLMARHPLRWSCRGIWVLHFLVDLDPAQPHFPVCRARTTTGTLTLRAGSWTATWSGRPRRGWYSPRFGTECRRPH
jgi:hypothetical protein